MLNVKIIYTISKILKLIIEKSKYIRTEFYFSTDGTAELAHVNKKQKRKILSRFSWRATQR